MGNASSVARSIATRMSSRQATAPERSTEPGVHGSAASEADQNNTVLYIELHEGRSLAAMDASGFSDPYVIFRWAGQEMVSIKRLQTLDPAWDQTFLMFGPKEEMGDLKVTVMDWDRIGSDDLIGETSIPVPAAGGSDSDWYCLDNPSVKDGKTAGDIRVSVRRVFRATFNDKESTLRVKIVEAKSLAAMDVGGTSDPYVVVTYQGRSRKTTVHKKTLACKFGEHFDLPAFEGNVHNPERVQIEVYDWDRFGSDDLIGVASVPVPCKDEMVTDVWCDLMLPRWANHIEKDKSKNAWKFGKKGSSSPNKGKDFGYNDLDEKEEEISRGRLRIIMRNTEESALGQEDCDLTLTVKDGRRIIHGAGEGGAPRLLYAVASFGRQVYQTTSQPETTAPRWEESFDWPVCSENTDSVVMVQVFDTVQFGPDLFIGQTQLEILRTMPFDTVKKRWLKLIEPGGHASSAEILLETELKVRPKDLAGIGSAAEFRERRHVSIDMGQFWNQPDEDWVGNLPRRASLSTLVLSGDTPEGRTGELAKQAMEDDERRALWENEMDRRKKWDFKQNKAKDSKRQENLRARDRNQAGLCASCGLPFNILQPMKKCDVCGMLFHVHGVTSVEEHSCYSIHRIHETDRIRNERAEAQADAKEMQRRRAWERQWDKEESIRQARREVGAARLQEHVTKGVGIKKPTQQAEIADHISETSTAFRGEEEAVDAAKMRMSEARVGDADAAALNAAALAIKLDTDNGDQEVDLIAQASFVAGLPASSHYNIRPNTLRGCGIVTANVYVATDWEDMKAERRALHAVTFPLLNSLLIKHKVAVQAVDLRSGVPRPQSLSREAVLHALDEIDRCRPMFLCLLGERYGFIPDDVWEGLGVPENSRHSWLRSVPPNTSLLHLEVLHAVTHGTKPREGMVPHGHRDCFEARWQQDPSVPIPPSVLAAYGADYPSESSITEGDDLRTLSSIGTDFGERSKDKSRTRHAFPQSVAPGVLEPKEEAEEAVEDGVPIAPSSALFYMRNPSFLKDAEFLEASTQEQEEMEAARRNAELLLLERKEREEQAAFEEAMATAGKEDEDLLWDGDVLEVWVGDITGLFVQKFDQEKALLLSGATQREEDEDAAMELQKAKHYVKEEEIDDPASGNMPKNAQHAKGGAKQLKSNADRFSHRNSEKVGNAHHERAEENDLGTENGNEMKTSSCITQGEHTRNTIDSINAEESEEEPENELHSRGDAESKGFSEGSSHQDEHHEQLDDESDDENSELFEGTPDNQSEISEEHKSEGNRTGEVHDSDLEEDGGGDEPFKDEQISDTAEPASPGDNSNSRSNVNRNEDNDEEDIRRSATSVASINDIGDVSDTESSDMPQQSRQRSRPTDPDLGNDGISTETPLDEAVDLSGIADPSTDSNYQNQNPRDGSTEQKSNIEGNESQSENAIDQESAQPASVEHGSVSQSQEADAGAAPTDPDQAPDSDVPALEKKADRNKDPAILEEDYHEGIGDITWLEIVFGNVVRKTRNIRASIGAWEQTLRLPVVSNLRNQGNGVLQFHLKQQTSVQANEKTISSGRVNVGNLIDNRPEFLTVEIGKAVEVAVEIKFSARKAISQQQRVQSKKKHGVFKLQTLKHCHTTENPGQQRQLRTLKDGLLLRANVYDNYPVDYCGLDGDGAVVFDGLETLAKRIAHDLFGAIVSEGFIEASKRRPNAHLVPASESQQVLFGGFAASHVGRQKELSVLQQYSECALRPPIQHSSDPRKALAGAFAGLLGWPTGSEQTLDRPIVVTGEPGCGITSLLAHFHKTLVDRAEEQKHSSDEESDRAKTILLQPVFVSASLPSNGTGDPETLLRLANSEIARRLHGSQVPGPKQGNLRKLPLADPNPLVPVPRGARMLAERMKRTLTLMSLRRPLNALVLTVDSVDRMADNMLEWVPKRLPPQSRLILGMDNNCDKLKLLMNSVPSPIRLDLKPLNMLERKSLVSSWLLKRRQRIDMQTRDALVSKKEAGHASYLQLATITMLMQADGHIWKNNDRVVAKVVFDLPDSIDGLCEQMISYLACKHHPVFTRRVLCLIEVSGDGDPGLSDSTDSDARAGKESNVSKHNTCKDMLEARDAKETHHIALDISDDESEEDDILQSGIIPLGGIGSHCGLSGSTSVAPSCETGDGMWESELRLALSLPEPQYDDPTCLHGSSKNAIPLHKWRMVMQRARELQDAEDGKEMDAGLRQEDDVTELFDRIENGGDFSSYDWSLNAPPREWATLYGGVPHALWCSLMRDIMPLLFQNAWQHQPSIQFVSRRFRSCIRNKYKLDVCLKDIGADKYTVENAAQAIKSGALERMSASRGSSRPATATLLSSLTREVSNPPVTAEIGLDLAMYPAGTLRQLAKAMLRTTPAVSAKPGFGQQAVELLPVSALYHAEVAFASLRMTDPEGDRTWLGSQGAAYAAARLPRQLHRAGLWVELKALLCSIGFVGLAANLRIVDCLLSQYTEALRAAEACAASLVPPIAGCDWWEGYSDVDEFRQFLASHQRKLTLRPIDFYQLASNEPASSAVAASALRSQLLGWYGRNFLFWANRTDSRSKQNDDDIVAKLRRNNISSMLGGSVRDRYEEALQVLNEREAYRLLDSLQLDESGVGAISNELLEWQPAQDMVVSGATAVRSVNRPRSVLFGHVGWVKAITFTVDDKFLVSAGDDQTLRVWDCDGGQQIADMTGHSSGVLSIDVSNDMERLASGGAEGMIKIWELSGCVEVGTLYVGSGVLCVQFSQDGDNLFAGCLGATIHMFHVATSVELRVFRGHSLAVRSLQLNSDGRHMVSSGSDCVVVVWDLQRPQDDPVLSLLEGHTKEVRSSVWIESTGQVASASDDGTVRLWRPQNGHMERVCKGHKGAVLCVAAPKNAGRVVSGGDDGVIRVWSALTGSCMAILTQAASTAVFSVCLSSDMGTIASAQSEGTVLLWDTASALTEDVANASELRGVVSSVPNAWKGVEPMESARSWFQSSRPGSAYSSRHALSAASRPNSGATVRSEVSRGHGIKVLRRRAPRMQKGAVTAVKFSLDGGLLASGSLDGTYAIRNVSTGEMVTAPRRVHGKGLLDLAWADNGETLVTCGLEPVVRVWDAETGNAINFFDRNGSFCGAVDFSRDKSFVAAGGADGHVRIWDVRAPPPVETPKTDQKVYHNPVTALAISRDSQYVLTGDSEGNVRLTDCRKLCDPMRWHAHTAKVTGASFGPAANTHGHAAVAATCGEDGLCAFWDMTGRVVGSVGRRTEEEEKRAIALTGETCKPLRRVCVSETGAHVAVCRDDGAVQVVDGHAKAAVANWVCQSAASAVAISSFSLDEDNTVGNVAVGDVTGRTYVLHPRLGTCGLFHQL